MVALANAPLNYDNLRILAATFNLSWSDIFANFHCAFLYYFRIIYNEILLVETQYLCFEFGAHGYSHSQKTVPWGMTIKISLTGFL